MPVPTVIVTGASSGIGLATTHWLLNDFGANVVAVSRHGSTELDNLARVNKVQSTAEQDSSAGKGSLMITHADVSKDEENKDLVENTLQDFTGSLDALVLAAGALEISRLADLDLSKARELLDTNVLGVLSIVKHALPYLRASKGKIIILSSGAASGETAGWGIYSASKAAINALVKTLSKEEPDVTSVAFRPGKVNTKMQAHIRAKGGDVMAKSDHDVYTTLHRDNELIAPDVIGTILATLAIKAAPELSGKYVNWSDDDMKPYR